MRLIVGFMFLVGVVLSLILLKFDLSDIQKAIILSLIVGIVVFIFVSSLIYSNYGNRENKDWDSEEQVRKRRTIAHTIGFILMIISIALFFNFYLYFKAMLGNDLLISQPR